MAEEIDELKKLSPKERIEKLKKIQEKDKKEIEEAQKLIKKAEQEAKVEEELKDIPIPQLKSVNIDKLFTAEEKALFRAKRFETGYPKEEKEEKRERPKEKELEAIAAQAPGLSPEEEKHNIEYLDQLSRKPTDQLYSRAKEIYSEFKEHGYLSHERQAEFNNIEYANMKKLEDIESGEYTEVSQAVANEMVLIEKMKNAVGYKR